MTLLADAALLVVGLALLLAGGEFMVRGAAALARQLGVPPLVVGLTVVAFGTSAPELAVNLTAAARGNGAVAFGNLIGSNLANIGLILASAALLRTLAIQSIIVTREMPMMIVASVATLVMGFDALRGQVDSHYDRAEGLLLLLLFAIFVYYTVSETLRKRSSDPFVEQVREHWIGARLWSLGPSIGVVVLGLAGLALGGQLTVAGAVEVAAALGAPKGLIGLTVVAVGTSLPELSASVMAARKGETDLAVGNVVGSNIFNLLFVLGVTATVGEVPVPPDGQPDLIVMLAFSSIVLLLSLGRREITRAEGALLLIGYLGYITWRVA